MLYRVLCRWRATSLILKIEATSPEQALKRAKRDPSGKTADEWILLDLSPPRVVAPCAAKGSR